jgi:hypothetical protein
MTFGNETFNSAWDICMMTVTKAYSVNTNSAQIYSRWTFEILKDTISLTNTSLIFHSSTRIILSFEKHCTVWLFHSLL